MEDDLDKIVAHLKANAIVPLTLTVVPKEIANGFDNGPDEEFLARLERGEHLNEHFLAAVDDPTPAIDHGPDEEFLARLERGEHLDEHFLKDVYPKP